MMKISSLCDAVFKTSTQRLSNEISSLQGSVSLFRPPNERDSITSSPTQTSNKSPRMKTASAGVFCMKDCHAEKVAGSSSCKCKSEMKSISRQWSGAVSTDVSNAVKGSVVIGTVCGISESHGLFNDHVFKRDVIMVTFATSFQDFDFVNNFCT